MISVPSFIVAFPCFCGTQYKRVLPSEEYSMSSCIITFVFSESTVRLSTDGAFEKSSLFNPDTFLPTVIFFKPLHWPKILPFNSAILLICSVSKLLFTPNAVLEMLVRFSDKVNSFKPHPLKAFPLIAVSVFPNTTVSRFVHFSNALVSMLVTLLSDKLTFFNAVN